MSEMTFTTSSLNDLDLNLINVLLTQAKHHPDDKSHVIRACKFVLNKLEETSA